MSKEINLLPKKRQEEMVFEGVLHSLRIVVWVTGLSFAMVLSGQFLGKVYLETQRQTIIAEIDEIKTQVDKKDNADLKNKIKIINDLITDYSNATTQAPKWSKVVEAFVLLPPEGVSIHNFDVEFGKKQIRITGNSPTRELVIELYNNILADEKNFYNINYPLENVAKPTNINFHFTFNAKDDLLK